MAHIGTIYASVAVVVENTIVIDHTRHTEPDFDDFIDN